MVLIFFSFSAHTGKIGKIMYGELPGRKMVYELGLMLWLGSGSVLGLVGLG